MRRQVRQQRIPRLLMLLLAATAALLATLDILGHTDAGATHHTSAAVAHLLTTCEKQACVQLTVGDVDPADEELACVAILVASIFLIALRRFGIARSGAVLHVWRAWAGAIVGRSPPPRGLLLTITAVSRT